MDDVKQQVIDRLKQANNILVTVRNNPNVDLLSACIGLALALDKMDKHAAAVFSGEVPSTIEFLKPEATLEKSPDSLRDFIIALDKSKADKLRYKVEDKVVRIFITPYKTSLSEKDLQFSQGDFNVDAVVALGAHEQQELDRAITQHGRILHDATVLSINNTPSGNLGSINWQDIGASSVCELVAQLVKDLGKDLLDEQIATALLTGIVAETGRFSNEKTTPRTMSLAGDLMSAGANQQLVANELQTAQPSSPTGPTPNEGGGSVKKAPPQETTKKPDDGTLEIDHERELPLPPPVEQKKPPEPSGDEEAANLPKIITPGRELLPPPEPHITNVHGSPLPDDHHVDQEYRDDETLPVARSYLVEEPTIPSSTPKGDGHVAEPSKINPFDVPSSEYDAPLLHRSSPVGSSTGASMPQPSQMVAPEPPPAILPPTPPSFSPVAPLPPVPPASPSSPVTPSPWSPPAPTVPSSTPPIAQPVSTSSQADKDETLEEIEESVHSPHLGQPNHSEPQDLAAARNEVLEALKQGPEPLEPLQSLNAAPLGASLHSGQGSPSVVTPDPSMDVEVDDEGNLKTVPTNEPAPNPESPANQPMDMPLPPIPGPVASSVPPVTSPSSSTAPPPVPPPMMPPNFMSPSGQ